MRGLDPRMIAHTTGDGLQLMRARAELNDLAASLGVAGL
jgi:hypothetical protein